MAKKSVRPVALKKKVPVAAPAAAKKTGAITLTTRSTPGAKSRTSAATKNTATVKTAATARAQTAKVGKVATKVEAGKVRAEKEVLTKPDISVQDPPYAALPFTRRVLRPRDLLVLDFTFHNLKVTSTAGSAPRLLRRSASAPAYIVIGFPPQHLLEQAYFERADETPIVKHPNKPRDPDQAPASVNQDAPPDQFEPVGSRLAEPSRLVFRVPSNFSGVPYTLDDILDAVRNWELSVAPSATPPDPRHFKLDLTRHIGVIGLDQRADVTKRAKNIAPAKGIRESKPGTARFAATRAYVAATEAEAHNQWYANRSPLTRGMTAVQEVNDLVAILDTIRVLPKLAAPTEIQTAIEAPTRLIISPNSFGAWVHASKPAESVKSGRVELWHTRLAVRAAAGVTERADFRRAIRAIWSPDVRADDPFATMAHGGGPFRSPLDGNDRHQIVHLSGNHHLYDESVSPKKRVVPLPIDVERLMLSSLGAWMDIRGAWTPPAGMSLEEWINRGTMGRDHYVRVVYAGRLFPFGHRASLIKVTERKFHPNKKGNAAYLRQRMFIVVREPFVLTGNTGDVAGSEKLDLKMPLKSARITTLVTPNLDDPTEAHCAVVTTQQGQKLFWPCVGGRPFLFHVQCEDEAGTLLNLSMPLVFLGNDLVANVATGAVASSVSNALAIRYSSYAGFENHRRIPLAGQCVQFGASRKQGDTSFEVSALEFMLTQVGGRLVPGVQGAALTLPALKNLAGAPGYTEVKYAKPYLQHGFVGGNSGEVLLELVTQDSTRLDFSQQGDRTGGLLTPNMVINGVSRTLGPFGGEIDKLAGGAFDPKLFEAMGDLLPKLFGCIPITELIASDISVANLDQVPRFITESLTAGSALLDDVGRISGYLDTLVSLGAERNALDSAASAVSAAVGALLADPLAAAKRTTFTTAFGTLCSAARSLRPQLGAFELETNEAFAKTKLEQVLAKFSVGLESSGAVSELALRIADSIEALNEQRIKFEWKPPIQNWPSGSSPLFELRGNGALIISVEMAVQSGTSKEPSLDVACRLQNFDLNLIPDSTFLKLKFNQLEFTTSSRAKADVNVEFDDIEFVGVLSFIETLRTLIPLDGFSDPPALEISEQGIEASFSLGVPTIAVGVFTLANLNLGAALTVPFVGNQPLSVRFNFCERSDPFRVTVWIFGGGGFFAVTVTPAGCQILEASFEFGASCALDFGVASGSVSVMAGVYFKIETDEASLTGYFNVKGCVDVMGLISASLELNLELTYQFSSGKCIGRASMIVEIDVLLFSGSVEIECEKKFAGSNGDPSFLQIMAPYTDPITRKRVEPWASYCSSFA